MQKYELTIVLPGDATATKKKSFGETLGKLLKVGGGEIKKEADWGKMELAYKIKKQADGVFLYFELELEPKSAKFLSDKLRLEDTIIRHLLIRK
jgi:small subunit ribosomal protein S6